MDANPCVALIHQRYIYSRSETSKRGRDLTVAHKEIHVGACVVDEHVDTFDSDYEL
jgi:hypothetical protein